ncbi:MAG: tetratricopeptide repeat protein [Bacteroidia bacterium]
MSASIYGSAKDSLWAVFNNTEAEIEQRLKSIDEVCYKFYVSSVIDSIDEVARKMLRFAQHKNSKKYEANAYHFLGYHHIQRNDKDSAFAYYAKSLAIRQEIKDTLGLGRSYGNIGGFYQNTGDYEKSVENLKKSIHYFELLGTKDKMALSYVALAGSYKLLGDYNKAINALKKSSKHLIELNNDYFLVSNLMELASTYKLIGDYNKAIETLNKCIEVSKKIGNHETLSGSYNLLAKIYTSQNDLDMALLYAQKSLFYIRKNSLNFHLASALSTLGEIMLVKGEILAAIDTLEKALTQTVGDVVDSDEMGLYISLGNAHVQNGNYNKGMYYCKSALEKIVKRRNITSEKLACNCLYRATKGLKQNDMALYYFERISEIEKELNSQAASREVLALETEISEVLDSIDQAKQTLELKNKIAKAKQATNRRNLIQYSLVVIIVLLLATAIAVATKFKISPRLASGLIFIFFILLFEFLLVVLDPWVDSISNGEVGWKIGINTAIALVLFGIHQASEKRLKTAILKADR